jgi:hypothetical protein
MTQIDPDLPIIGASVSTEEPKVKNALEELVSTINALDTANLKADAGITGGQLADTTIPASKLASNAVETAKIVDDAVTAAKLKDSVATDADRAVTTDHIRDAAVTTGKVADSAVTTAKLATGAVTTAKIGAAQVTAEKLSLSINTSTGIATTNTGSGQTLISNLAAILVPGTWLLLAQISISRSLSASGMATAQLYNVSDSSVMGEKAVFMSGDAFRTVTLVGHITNTSSKTIGVRIGSADISATGDPAPTITAVRLG